MRVLKECQIPRHSLGKDVPQPGMEKKMGVIQGGEAQPKSEVRQAIGT